MKRSVASDLRLPIGGRIHERRRRALCGRWLSALCQVIGAFVTGALYGGAYRFLYWIIARTDYVGGLLTAVLLDYLMLIVGHLLLSSFIAALAEVLLSDDLVLLRAAPMREEAPS